MDGTFIRPINETKTDNECVGPFARGRDKLADWPGRSLDTTNDFNTRRTDTVPWDERSTRRQDAGLRYRIADRKGRSEASNDFEQDDRHWQISR